MSQRLSTSATFLDLESRVASLENVAPLPSTLKNNFYLYATKHNDVKTRIFGINSTDDLYIGGIDTSLNSFVVTLGGSSSIELTPSGTHISGSLNVSTDLEVSTIVSRSANGYGGTVKILGASVAGYTGVVQFHKLDGSRNGYIGFNAESGPMQYGSDTGAGHAFDGGAITVSSVGDEKLRLKGTDSPYIGGYDAGGTRQGYLQWSAGAGILNANAQAKLAINGSSALVADASGVFVANVLNVGDSNFGLSLNGGNQPLIAYDAGDYFSFTRSGNVFNWVIGNASKATLDSNGLTLAGTELIVGNDSYFRMSLGSGSPRVTFDNTDYLFFDRVANAFNFCIGGATKIVMDTGGLFSAGVLATGDVNFMLGLSSSQPTITFDTGGDALIYNRSTNTQSWTIGGVQKAALDPNGFSHTGALIAGSYVQAGDGYFFLQLASATKPQITFDSGDALYYDRTANKLYLQIGGVNVASIDASGNLKIKGTLTQGATTV
jgi:hypothetical protein